MAYHSARPSFLSRALQITDSYLDSSHPANSPLLPTVRLGQPVPEPLRSCLFADEREYEHADILEPKRNRSILPDDDGLACFRGVVHGLIVVAITAVAVIGALVLMEVL